jgi:hypothetical protein
MPTFEESFCQAEEEALHWLVAEHSFRAIARQVREDQSSHGTYAFVKYAAGPQSLPRLPDDWQITLSLAPMRLELDLTLSASPGGDYTVEELHALDGTGQFPPRQHGLYEAMHKPQELSFEFQRLAGALRAAGARFFAGDSKLWLELAAQRSRRAQDAEDKLALASSELAFQAKDWQRVVHLLEPRTSRLSKASSARLAYAKKQVKGAT